MRLLFIYGPPASGKYTIGSEIAKRTGYKFFHNHVTVPVAHVIFPDAHEQRHGEAYSILLKQLRLIVIQAAAQEDVNLIFTLAYSGEVDDAFIDHIVQAVESNGGDVYFLQLTASDNTLMERVNNLSRKKLAKMDSPVRLKQVLETRDMRASVKYPNILHLDTSVLSPIEACNRVAKHFGLQKAPDK